MSRGVRNILIFLGILIIGVIGWYGGMAYFYGNPSVYYNEKGETLTASATEKCFMYGTYINNQYCTGMTVEQAEERLLKQSEPGELSVIIEGEKKILDAEKIGYKLSFEEPLKEAMNKQNVFMWPIYAMGKAQPITVLPTFTIDSESAEKVLDELGISEASASKDQLCIELTEEDGYVLNDAGVKPVLKAKEAREFVVKSILAGETEISIGDEFYVEHEFTDGEKKLISYFEDIDKFQNKKVSYKFGRENKNITKTDWATLLNVADKPVEKITPDMLDKEILSYDIDEKKASAFIENFLDEYNTYQNRFFKTNSGKTVYIPRGYYGNQIDIAKEQAWFCEFVKSNQTGENRVPTYLIEKAKYKEKDDIGNTYVEISIDDQHMWYYKNGKLFVDTDVTTGAPYHGGTPCMSVMIQNQIRNKTLVGPNYRSFVKYWMGLNGGYGIHDASWRKVYGGEEYIHNGSHGCINTPLEKVIEIFENIEVGTPVFIYSLKENSLDNLEELRKPENKKVLK